jgi:hypothetical protein
MRQGYKILVVKLEIDRDDRINRFTIDFLKFEIFLFSKQFLIAEERELDYIHH